MSWQGFGFAFVIIAVPDILLNIYSDRALKNYRADGRVAGGCATGFALIVWLFAGLLIADWATPDFDIGGWWQYFVLLAFDFAVNVLVAFALNRKHYVELWRGRHRSADTS